MFISKKRKKIYLKYFIKNKISNDNFTCLNLYEF